MIAAGSIRSAQTAITEASNVEPIPIRRRSATVLVVLTTCVVSLLFGLPHLLTPALLGPERVYTPFAVSGVSALTYDETSSYAAYVNYTLRHLAPPYDTDVYEDEHVPVPTTMAPYVILAGAAAALGGVDRAFILADFVLPPVALLIVYALLFDITRRRALALVGSLTVLLVSFGPRNLFSPILQPTGYDPGGIIQPLEFSRDVHPEVSFTLLVASLWLLWRTLRTNRPLLAVVAGALGALLFYTYLYYWPVWLGACLALLLFDRDRRRVLWLTNVVTWLCTIPFWWSLLEDTRYPGLANVLARHTSELGHVPPPAKIAYTIVATLVFAVCAAVYIRFGPPHSMTRRRVLLYFSAVFAAALAALNMEVLVGFNVESMLHFPNRLFQPFLTIAVFALASRPLVTRRFGVAALLVGGGILLGLGGFRQVTVTNAVAAAHEYTPQHRLLFDWLNANTHLDDVVLATARDVNDLIPVYTQDRVFVPNGERTSASSQEIGERFLIAMKLLGHSEDDVRALMAQDVQHGDPPLGLTYTYFLFLGTDNWRLPESQIDSMLEEFRKLDLNQELGQRRVNYVYGRGDEQPRAVSGYTFREAYSDTYGKLWQVIPSAN
ncbi:MAG: hypothetical protein JOZ87_09320 [Chloroflexi bacterium]|nr:hypothetical protein [Chloroflexota bacterium]